MENSKAPPAFEEALQELESIVERMEEGEPSLEESLKLFERGMDLARTCQKALDDAEQRIQTLTDSGVAPMTVQQDEDPGRNG